MSSLTLVLPPALEYFAMRPRRLVEVEAVELEPLELEPLELEPLPVDAAASFVAHDVAAARSCRSTEPPPAFGGDADPPFPSACVLAALDARFAPSDLVGTPTR